MSGGTIVCGVRESADGRSAAQLARALGARLGLRLVLVHVVDGVPAFVDESLTARQRQAGAELILNAIAREIGNGTEKRIVLGEPAQALAEVAAEEGADLIVLGSRSAGLGSRKLRCTLARELEAATPVPVLVAPPDHPRAQRPPARGGSRREHAVEHQARSAYDALLTASAAVAGVRDQRGAARVRDAAARGHAGDASTPRLRSSRESTSASRSS